VEGQTLQELETNKKSAKSITKLKKRKIIPKYATKKQVVKKAKKSFLLFSSLGLNIQLAAIARHSGHIERDTV
jgi:hypothetical protein